MGGASFYNYQVTKIMPRWAVGVGVNLKIFDGLNREYKYSAAKQTVKQVEVLEMKAGKDIAVLIEKLYNQMNNYANQMKSIDASLAFAEEYLKAKNAAFLEGCLLYTSGMVKKGPVTRRCTGFSNRSRWP